METQNVKKLYSINNTAAALDVSRGHVYNLIRSGNLEFVLVGTDRRIPASEIERIATQGTTK